MRRLGNDHPGKRRSNDVVPDALTLKRNRLFSYANVLFAGGQASGQRIHIGAGFVGGRLGAEATTKQLNLAITLACCLAQLGAGFVLSHAGAVELRLVQPKLHLVKGAIQAGQDLSGLNRHTLFNQYFGDFARYLRGHGRAATRRDIARRVQH